jgi:hypothetical protein
MNLYQFAADLQWIAAHAALWAIGAALTHDLLQRP